VAEAAGDRAEVDPGAEESGGDEVAEVVEPDVSETDLLGDAPEGSADPVRSPRATSRGVAAEHVAIGCDGPAVSAGVNGDPSAMCGQRIERRPVEVDASAASGLGRPDDGLAAPSSDPDDASTPA